MGGLKPYAAALSLAASLLLVLVVLADMRGRSTALLLQRPRVRMLPTARPGREMALWDFENGGPTDSDDSGNNYNPVVLDDTVTRKGYPATVEGWQEWTCGGSDSLMNEYPCVNTPK
mmetsp:Transcript_20030/g.40558  ORF Transcript_20030/g.40558 Transcript_20030/m.40558 type:complete len:117 (-) Transcript_20030:43-393(-)